MDIEVVRNVISRLNTEERDIIECPYFNDETVCSVAKLKSITHPTSIKRKNKFHEKLNNISKNFKIQVTKVTKFSLI